MMHFDAKYTSIVDEVIDEFGKFDLVVSGQVDRSHNAHHDYLRNHRHEYIRTVQDVATHGGQRTDPIRVLEIGAFFGVVSICLSKLGCQVTASDVPEYISMPEQQARYAKHDIRTAGIRLQDYILPFEDESFDVIIMCEVLEHLNFNPLPLIKEINRIGADGSLFYLSLPNQTNIYNRIDFLRGRSIGVPVESFFRQLDPADPEIANNHWREYTAADIREMLLPLGYGIKRQYFFSLGETLEATSPRRRLAQLFYRLFPSLKENQTTLAIKERRTELRFDIPKTVHPTLGSL
jgi:2-polyprenyl-3-methyl-5-hydroxy-6-metoxy-1,4-benzoquinol methylase